MNAPDFIEEEKILDTYDYKNNLKPKITLQ